MKEQASKEDWLWSKGDVVWEPLNNHSDYDLQRAQTWQRGKAKLYQVPGAQGSYIQIQPYYHVVSRWLFWNKMNIFHDSSDCINGVEMERRDHVTRSRKYACSITYKDVIVAIRFHQYSVLSLESTLLNDISSSDLSGIKIEHFFAIFSKSLYPFTFKGWVAQSHSLNISISFLFNVNSLPPKSAENNSFEAPKNKTYLIGHHRYNHI